MPPTYVFEDLRGVLLDHVLRADLMLTGLAINSLLFAATAVIYTRHAARLIRQQRPNGGPFIVGELISLDSRLPLGSLNHDPAACLDSERIYPSEAKS